MAELNLSDIQTLSDLSAAAGRFRFEVQEALRAPEAEIRRTLEWLRERVQHWQREVERAQREVQRARRSLEACLASGTRDDQGRYYPPNCSAQERAMVQAQAYLRECEACLRTALAWQSRVETEAGEYRRATRRLVDAAGAHTEKTRAFLARASDRYSAVLRAGADVASLAALSAVIGRGAASGISPAVWASAVVRASGKSDDPRGSLAQDLNEAVTLDELGLAAVQFDQAKHGFDSVLQAPGGKIIVLESKLSSSGDLALGTTVDGYMQGSAGWVERVAGSMTDSGSAQWSPDNERIGREILQQGADQVPVLAAVFNPGTGSTDIYLRTDADAASWKLLSGGLPAGGEP